MVNTTVLLGVNGAVAIGLCMAVDDGATVAVHIDVDVALCAGLGVIVRVYVWVGVGVIVLLINEALVGVSVINRNPRLAADVAAIESIFAPYGITAAVFVAVTVRVAVVVAVVLLLGAAVAVMK